MSEQSKQAIKPINIPDDIAARCTGPDQARRMDALFRKVIDAPRSTAGKDSAKRAGTIKPNENVDPRTV